VNQVAVGEAWIDIVVQGDLTRRLESDLGCDRDPSSFFGLFDEDLMNKNRWNTGSLSNCESDSNVWEAMSQHLGGTRHA
jgi:hypothetical protein